MVETFKNQYCMNLIKITAIICAFNEDKTISEVVNVLIGSSDIDELIVVDDGSVDKTRSKLEKFHYNPKFHLINNPSNMGKGYAMVEGILKAKNELLLFVDADIKNLSTLHIKALIHPLIDQQADMIIGHPADTVLGHQYNPFKMLSGQRALYKKDIYPITDRMRTSRFGVETLINLHFSANKKTIVVIPLAKLNHPIKTQKYPIFRATVELIKEAFQIGQTILFNRKLVINCLSNAIKRN